MKLSFQKLYYVIGTGFGLFAFLILAKPILIPITIALLMAFILYPLAKKLESWRFNKIIAAFLAIFSVILVIGGVIFFFSTQIIELSKEFSNFKDKIILAFTDVTLFINKNVSFVENLKKNELFNMMNDWLHNSTGALVSQTFSNTATFFAGLIATIVFTFLILIYRHGLIQAYIGFTPEDKRDRVIKMIKTVQVVGQKYFLGMILLVGLIGLANSLGLWIIGIDNPFLFGFLGATMSIVPYVGTFVGAFIPFIYAFVSFNSPWHAVAVAVLFWAVQLITDNYLSPKIVGGSLNVNALTAILSLIIGAVVWGVAGMILFLPFAAMFKVICEEYDELRPIAILIGSQNYSEKEGESIFFSKLLKMAKTRFHKIFSGKQNKTNAD